MVRTSEKATSLCIKLNWERLNGQSHQYKLPQSIKSSRSSSMTHESVMSHELDDSGPYAVLAKLLRASQALTERA
jgi:hypothetical protein